MGMDVYGKAPRSSAGEYFRNNVWWWHPLWDFCCSVDCSLEERVPDGHINAGDGLDDEGAKALAMALMESLEDGYARAWHQARNEHIAELPRRECQWCESSGIRRDEVGRKLGMPERALEQAQSIILNRTHGWCNGCDGLGSQDPWLASYSFSLENVREFALFLQDCGGFEIH